MHRRRNGHRDRDLESLIDLWGGKTPSVSEALTG